MLRTPHSLRIALFSLPLFFLALTTHAQTPSPNDDILKMLAAGLPESTIVNKINSGAGHWDTSVDALIALKKAGATEAELTALSKLDVATPAQQSQAIAPPVISVLGGTVTNQNGNVTFMLPSSPNPGAFVLRFQVVLVEGNPALKLSTEAVYEKNSGDWSLSYGDLLFTPELVRYYDYVDAGSAHGNPFPTWIANTTTEPVAFQTHDISPVPFTMWLKEGQPVSEDYAFINGKGYFEYRDFWPVTNFYPKKAYPAWGFRLGSAYDRSSGSLEARHTFDLILHNFDEALDQILKAAGIEHPATDLSVESRFKPVTPEQLAQIISARNAEIQRRRQDFALLGKNARHMEGGDPRDGTSSSSNGFLAFTNAMQGFSNMRAAVQQGNIAAANHDMSGQLQAALNAGTAEVNTIQAVTNPTTQIQPTYAQNPNGIQTALAQQQAAIAAKAAQAAKPVQTASSKSTFSYDPAPPSPPKIALSSGTAPPPTCVDLGPGNCMPIAQYQQMLAQQKAQAQQVAANTQICPPSGIVPGPGHYAACDAYIGQQVSCVPGQPVAIAVPPPPPASCGPVNTPAANLNTPAVGSGEGNAMGCMIFTPDNQGNVNVQNNCPFTVHYYWVGYNDPNSTKNDVVQAGGTDQFSPGGQYRVYACNNAYFTDGPDGRIVHGIVDNFMCVKK